MVRRDGALVALVLVVALGVCPALHAADDAADGMPDTISGSEPADIAFELGYDVDAIFRFVADHIRFEPYVGVLRGVQGTLDARAGNSADQALLLAALLNESAVPYRFARGPLDEIASAGLLDSTATDAGEARRIVEEALARGLDELLADVATAPEPSADPSADSATAPVGPTAAEAEAQLALATSRLDESVGLIHQALDGAGIGLPVDGPTLPSAEALNHTWVQVPFGAEWLDLDPTLAGSEPRAVLSTMVETFDELPDDLRHVVNFEVLVERVQGGQLVTEPILEYTAYADEIAGVPLVFGHVTPGSVERFGVTLLNVLGDGRLEYRPSLDIGPVTLIADEPVAFGQASLDGGGGLFEGSGLLGDEAASGEETGPPEGEATAEWLTISVTSPGSEPVVARRTVFDRLPAVLRHGGEVTVEAVEPIELADVDGSGSADYLPMLGIEAFAVATGPTSAAQILSLLPVDEFGAAAFAYHGLRDALSAAAGIEAGSRSFVDGPNIVSFSIGAIEPGQAATIRFGLDIWHRNFGILPLTGSSLTPAEAEVVAGVMGHVAERVALDSLSDTSDLDQHAVGVGALFEAAVREGIPTRVLHGSIPEPLPYGPAATALIEAAVASGEVVIAPAEPVTLDERALVGWWGIDPATGATADVFETGAGTESAEYEIQMGQTVRYYRCNGPLSNFVIVQVLLQHYLGHSIAALDQGPFDRFVRPRMPGQTNCWTFTVVG